LFDHIKKEDVEGLGCTIQGLNNFILKTKFPFQYETDNNPGACYSHFRKVFQRVSQVRMIPVNGGHRSWAMNRIISCFGFGSAFPLSYHLQSRINTNSTICQRCSIETLYYKQYHDLTIIQNISRESALKDTVQAEFTILNWMQGLIDRAEVLVNQTIESMKKKPEDGGGFHENTQKILDKYSEFPLSFDYIGKEPLGQNFSEEAFSNVLNILKWQIYKEYRATEKIRDDEAKIHDKDKNKDVIEILEAIHNNADQLPIKQQKFGFLDKPATIHVKSFLNAKVNIIF